MRVLPSLFSWNAVKPYLPSFRRRPHLPHTPISPSRVVNRAAEFAPCSPLSAAACPLGKPPMPVDVLLSETDVHSLPSPLRLREATRAIFRGQQPKKRQNRGGHAVSLKRLMCRRKRPPLRQVFAILSATDQHSLAVGCMDGSTPSVPRPHEGYQLC